jgi:flotillin
MGTELTVGAIIGGLLLAMIVFFIAVLSRFLYICEPNEVIVFTGRTSTVNGKRMGYSTLRTGRRVRWPFVEEAIRLDTSTMTVDVRVTNAYSKGNIPLNVHAIANVRISRDDGVLENAIERFLGRNREEIRRVAKETIEGVLRGVLAKLTPEQVNEDRLKFVQALSEDAEDDLRRIGLRLDTLNIQSVTDEVNYLDSIGRERIAEALRDAEMAESNNRRQAEAAIAESEARGRVAQEQAQAIIQSRRNAVRQKLAELNAEARSAEERTVAAETEARARAEVKLQDARTELERLRLQADEVLPAEAAREASLLRAEGDAAPIAAQGHATAEALRLLNDAWDEAGDHASDIILLQQLESILDRVVDQLSQIKIARINVIDTGDGKGLGRLAGAYPAMVAAVLDEVGTTTGFDIRRILTRGLDTANLAEAAPRVARPARPVAAAPAAPAAPSTRSSTTAASSSAASATKPAAPAEMAATSPRVVPVPRGLQASRATTVTGSNLKPTTPAADSPTPAQPASVNADWMRRTDKED